MRQPAFDTLVAMMAHRASATPDKTACTFVDGPIEKEIDFPKGLC